MQRRALFIWTALIAPLWIALILCTHWEPILRDTWGHYLEHMHVPMSFHAVWEFARDSYLHNNPRLGQTITMLLVTPGPWHAIVTPIVEIGLFVQLAALALGRWPSLRRTDDALTFAAILALVACSAPQLGPMLFYRPFTGNYVFGFAISLAFVLPYRFFIATPHDRSWWWIPIMLVAGAAAGMSNEHTAPACVLVACACVVACWRRGVRPPVWMVVGIVGAIAAGIALFVAPGQAIRYNGMAAHEGLFARIASRGIVRDLGVVFGFVGYSWKMLVVLAATFGFARMRRRRLDGTLTALVLAGAACAISLTLLASPKQGARLDFAPICLLAAAVAAIVVPAVAEGPARAAAWGLSAIAIAYLVVACVATYAIVGPEGARRLAAIEQAPKGSVVTVEPYSVAKSRWFLGDDFVIDAERRNIAMSFSLAGILVASPDHGK
ncbi:MAG TPA: DUF6056 family protein [Kofleriaceae bacterium]|jgi:hypothetical protein